jgi:cobalt-zinc-cadmium efflux system outer membrane protein
MRNLAISILILFSTLVFAEEKNFPEFNKDNVGYDLYEIIDIALEHNPSLTALKLELKAAEARIVQSGLWPNPVFDAESENFSGDLPGFNYTENTFSITQPLLLGGKIDLKRDLAETERLIIKCHYETEKLTLIAEIEHSFYHILLTQQILEYAKETRDTAKQLYDYINAKKNAKDSKLIKYEILSAEIELSQAELEVMNVKRNLEISKNNLVILCGDQNISIDKVRGDLDREFNIPEYNTLKECILKNNFNIKSAEEYEKRADILLKISKADRIPDVDLGFGVRQFEEDNSYTFVAGLSFPLPLFNRNQGSIQEALINTEKVEVDKKGLINNLLIKFNEFYEEYQTSLQNVTAYKNLILPSAQEYYAVTVNRYEDGSLQYIDVLFAKRKLIEAKKHYTESLHILQKSIATLENLCSKRFHDTGGKVF